MLSIWPTFPHNECKKITKYKVYILQSDIVMAPEHWQLLLAQTSFSHLIFLTGRQEKKLT